MIETKKKNIKGHDYNITVFSASKAVKIGCKLMSVMSSGDIFGKLAELEQETWLDLFSQTVRDNVAINEATFDNIYTGKLGELLEAGKFVLEVNFADFLQEKGIGELLGLEKATKLEVQTSEV